MNERQVANKALELADKLWTNYLDNNECSHGFALSSGCRNDDCEEQAIYDAAKMLRSQEKYINLLHKLLNANNIGAGRNLLTGEVIPFEVEDEQ